MLIFRGVSYPHPGIFEDGFPFPQGGMCYFAGEYPKIIKKNDFLFWREPPRKFETVQEECW